MVYHWFGVGSVRKINIINFVMKNVLIDIAIYSCQNSSKNLKKVFTNKNYGAIINSVLKILIKIQSR